MMLDPSGKMSLISLEVRMGIKSVLSRSLAYVSYTGFISGVMGVIFGIPYNNAFQNPSADILQYEGGHSATTFSVGFDIISMKNNSGLWYAPFLGTYSNFSLKTLGGKINKFTGRLSVGIAYNLKTPLEYEGFFFAMSGLSLKLIRPDLNGKYPAKATLFTGTKKNDGTTVYGWLENIPGSFGDFLNVGIIGAGASYYPHVFAWQTINNFPFSKLGILMGKANREYLNILNDILTSSEY